MADFLRHATTNVRRPDRKEGEELIPMREFRKELKGKMEQLRIDPEFAEAYSGRSAMRLALGENQAAYDDAVRAIALNPQLSPAYSNRALAEIRLSRLGTAIETATQALKIDPKNADAYGYRGLAKALQGNFSEALDDLNAAIPLAPANARNRVLASQLATHGAGEVSFPTHFASRPSP